MSAAYVVVLADNHPVRDAWVDEQARMAPPAGGLVSIGDATYQGVWRMPPPYDTLVHLFSDPGDLPRIEQGGMIRT